MQIITFQAENGADITRYGSSGVKFTPLTRAGEGGVAVMHVAAGGEIGRHRADIDQLFVVVAGRGRVCGRDGQWQPIGPGQAALWTVGEEHTTQAEEPITAIVVEVPQSR